MAVVELKTDGLVRPFLLVDIKNKVGELSVGSGPLIKFDCTRAAEGIPSWTTENNCPVTRFEQIGQASWGIVAQKR